MSSTCNLLELSPEWTIDVQRGPDWVLVGLHPLCATQPAALSTQATNPPGKAAQKQPAKQPVGAPSVDSRRVDLPHASASLSAPPHVSLADQLWHLLVQHSSKRMLIDLREVLHPDGQLVDELLALRERITSHGGQMRICGMATDTLSQPTLQPLTSSMTTYVDRLTALQSSVPGKPR